MSHQYPGALVTFEGIDGAGKTELLHTLAQQLTTQGYEVVVTKEPGGTHIGRLLKKVLLEEEKECIPRVEYLLFAADRAEHFSTVVIPALKRGALVLSDRMADSAVAYQGFGRGLNIELITAVNAWAMHDIKPDVTFYVRVPYEVALERRTARPGTCHTLEREKEQFWRKVIAGYDQLAAQEKRFATLDGTNSRDTVVAHALAHIMQLQSRKPELSCGNIPVSGVQRSD